MNNYIELAKPTKYGKYDYDHRLYAEKDIDAERELWKQKVDELKQDNLRLREENLRFQTLWHVGDQISAEEVAIGYNDALERAEEAEAEAKVQKENYLDMLHKVKVVKQQSEARAEQIALLEDKLRKTEELVYTTTNQFSALLKDQNDDLDKWKERVQTLLRQKHKDQEYTMKLFAHRNYLQAKLEEATGNALIGGESDMDSKDARINTYLAALKMQEDYTMELADKYKGVANKLDDLTKDMQVVYHWLCSDEHRYDLRLETLLDRLDSIVEELHKA